MNSKKTKVNELVQKVIKNRMTKLEEKDIKEIAGDLSVHVRTQLDALVKSDGCWCPRDPPGCKC